jgi:hypothetical protein
VIRLDKYGARELVPMRLADAFQVALRRIGKVVADHT